MITHHKAQERRRDRHRELETWITVFPQIHTDPRAPGVKHLEILNEDQLPPAASVARHPRHAAEILTYVREGALAYEDSTGHSGVLRAGEFQRMNAGRGVHHVETNASKTDWTHVFQLWLRPSEGELEPSHEQKRFSAAQRRGRLCLVASPDARKGSLRVRQDVLMYAAILGSGQHVVHELARGRRAWLHVVQGEVSLGDVLLITGDGAAVTGERAVSLTALAETEILLFDLGERLASSPAPATP
jgi:redox-sensitive bicupin YhaK (pirin superfamily)